MKNCMYKQKIQTKEAVLEAIIAETQMAWAIEGDSDFGDQTVTALSDSVKAFHSKIISPLGSLSPRAGDMKHWLLSLVPGYVLVPPPHSSM